jgi:photosystem II stability/assembly factor-like uncharacterized protein
MIMNRYRLLSVVAAGLALTFAGAIAASAAAAAVSAGTGTGRSGHVSPDVGPVPRGFEPDSFTFVSANDGWVLGTAPCAHKPCTSVVRTTDGGHSWAGIPAPLLGLASYAGAPGLDRIRFADGRDGFAYGSQLWVTHDGGARWARVRQVPGYIADLEASDGLVYAASYRSNHIAIYRSPAAANDWRRVASLPVVAGFGGLGTITLYGKAAWIILGNRIYASQNSRTWSRESVRCPRFLGYTSIAADSSKRVTLLCTGNPGLGNSEKVLYASSDGGGRYAKVGSLPTGGDGGVLAEPTTKHLFVATSSAATWIYVSTDGGKRWHNALSLDDGGKGWNDFGFTTAVQGAAVEGTPAVGSRMYMTWDAGVRWHIIRF